MRIWSRIMMMSERDSLTTNDAMQLNILPFSNVPDGIRP